MKRKEIPTQAKKTIKSFEGAKKNAQDLAILKEGTQITDKGGRPIKGQSKATHQIRFNVDDETLAWLLKQTVKADGMPAKERTAHAVVKKILTAQFELANP
jgi:hypothetical protein